MKPLAYFDSFAGLIPCRVLEFGKPYSDEITLKLTATRGAYKRGEVLISNRWHVIPRNAVYTRAGIYRIRPFKWAEMS